MKRAFGERQRAVAGARDSCKNIEATVKRDHDQMMDLDMQFEEASMELESLDRHLNIH